MEKVHFPEFYFQHRFRADFFWNGAFFFSLEFHSYFVFYAYVRFKVFETSIELNMCIHFMRFFFSIHILLKIPIYKFQISYTNTLNKEEIKTNSMWICNGLNCVYECVKWSNNIYSMAYVNAFMVRMHEHNAKLYVIAYTHSRAYMLHAYHDTRLWKSSCQSIHGAHMCAGVY